MLWCQHCVRLFLLLQLWQQWSGCVWMLQVLGLISKIYAPQAKIQHLKSHLNFGLGVRRQSYRLLFKPTVVCSLSSPNLSSLRQDILINDLWSDKIDQQAFWQAWNGIFSTFFPLWSQTGWGNFHGSRTTCECALGCITPSLTLADFQLLPILS